MSPAPTRATPSPYYRLQSRFHGCTYTISSTSSSFTPTRHRRNEEHINQKTSTTTIQMNISTNDFRTGTTIEMEGIPYRVIEFLHVKPGKGAAFVRSKLKNMKTGNNIDKTFKAGEMITTAQLEKSAMQHTYTDGDDYVFMNVETFDEERMTADIMGNSIVKYLKIGQEVEVLKHNEVIIGVELPKNLVFEIIATEPGVKGNSSSGNVLKPATIETGAVISVPLFVNVGDHVRINLEDGKYLGRSND